MTLLRGHFAMMLLCAGDCSEFAIAEALAPLGDDGTLNVSVRAVPAEQAVPAGGSPYVLTVHGGDRPGIVSSVVAEVAALGGNITDLTTRLSGDLYLLIAEFDLPGGVDPATLEVAVAAAAATMGVRATVRPADVDEL